MGHRSCANNGRGAMRSHYGRGSGDAAKAADPRRHHHCRPGGAECATCAPSNAHHRGTDRQPDGGETTEFLLYPGC